MKAAEYPGNHGSVAFSSAQWHQGNTKRLQQNCTGLNQLESQASTSSGTRSQHSTPWNFSCGPQSRVHGSVHLTDNPGNDVGIARQTLPVDYQSEMVKHNPQLALLFVCEIPKDLELVQNTPRSEETIANINLNVSPPISDTRSSNSQQVQCSHVALNSNKARTQNLHHPSLFPRNQSSTENVSPAGENFPPTDAEIKEYIYKRVVAEFKNLSSQVSDNCRHESLREECDICMSQTNRTDNLYATGHPAKKSTAKQSPNCTVVEKCTTTDGEAPEDSSKESKRDSKFTPNSPDTEYPQIIGKIAANFTKTEDGSPVVLTAVSEITLDELTEQHQSSLLKCNSPEEYKSNDCNINKNMDNMDRNTRSSWPTNHMTDSEKQNTALKSIAIELENMQALIDVLKDVRTKSTSITSESLCENQETQTKNLEDHHFLERVAYSDLDSLTDIQIHNVISLVKEQTGVADNNNETFDGKPSEGPLYEDISDDENLPQLTCYVPQYENISEDENSQNWNSAMEMPTLAQESETTNKMSSFKKESCRHVQDVTIRKPEVISNGETIPAIHYCSSDSRFSASDNGSNGLSFPKCDSKGLQGWQRNLCCPSTALEDGSDYELDDNWIIIPIIISDLQTEDDAQCRSSSSALSLLEDGKIGHKDIMCDTSTTLGEQQKAVPSGFFLIEEFDTKESFQKAMFLQNSNILEVASGSHSVHELDSEREFDSSQNKMESYSEPEDSCDTDDSCNYPTVSKPNFLTASEELVKPNTAISPSKKEGEDDVENLKKGQPRGLDKSAFDKLGVLINAKRASKESEKKALNNDIIFIDSDTEDESDETYEEKVKSERLLSSGSDSNGDAPCGQQKRRSPETVVGEEKIKVHRQPSAESLESHQYDRYDSLIKELAQDACPDQHHSTEESEHFETKACSELRQHNRQRIVRNKSLMNLDSESDDDLDQKYTQGKRKHLFSTGSMHSGSAQRKRSTFNSAHGTAKEKYSKTLKCHDRRVTEIMEDSCSEQPDHFRDCERPTVAKDGSQHVQHITSRRGFAAERRNSKRSLSSESEEEQTASFATKNAHLNKSVENLYGSVKKPEKRSWSSQNATNKQTRFSEDVDSSLNTKLIIPRLMVSKSSRSTRRLTLSKDTTVHIDDNDETPEIPRCRNESPERNPACSNISKKVRFAPQEKPAIGGSSTKNEAKVVMPKLDSTRILLPRQAGSSSISCLSSTSRQHSEVGERFATCNGISQSGKTSSKQSILIPPLPLNCHRDRAPRQRRNSQKSDTPLMKSAIAVAVQRTRDIKQYTPKIPSYTVSEAYKWAEKQTVAKPATLKGFK